MKDNSIKISRGLASLIRKKEQIEIDAPEKEEKNGENISTIYEAKEVHTDEKIVDETDYDDEDLDEDEDEMGLEIESLIQREKVPSFLNRMQRMKSNDDEDKKPIPVSVKIQQIKDSEEEKKETVDIVSEEDKKDDGVFEASSDEEERALSAIVSIFQDLATPAKKVEETPGFIKKMKEMSKSEPVTKKEEPVSDFIAAENYTYDELLKKYKESISINNRLMLLVDKYESILKEKNELIEEQKELISEYEKALKPKKTL